MENLISSDKPVSEIGEDKFQRYEFSKRIADKIITSNDNDSIVIGISGAWGEGKTSVINFIEAELKKDTNIISIKFNPWRFTEEATLLVSFFNTLAIEIQKTFPLVVETKKKKRLCRWFNKIFKSKKEPLKTSKENIGEVLKNYGKMISIFGAGEVAESLGKVLSKVDIEVLKSRFEKLLIESKKKLVVFIDDIDRLDKQEIHSIFRLVKLTADFSNTYYILSFDQDMVASAIGERFGEGNKQAGINFLEKIIQVPLIIPEAQPDALKQYCFDHINKALDNSKINLTQKEVQRFISKFSNNIMCKLKTPRLAIRYGNSLSFSLPLLKGEVNMVDLMLMEALKVFYPEHYYFVKDNPIYFITSYSSTDNYSSNRTNNDVKKKEISEHFESLGKNLTKEERASVKSLLTDLFPRLDEAFNNRFISNGYIDWFKSKKVVSANYFHRYFSYTVIKGELSDVLFDQFILDINTESTEHIVEEIKELIQSSSIDNLLFKLRAYEEDFSWEVSQKLSICIVLSGDAIPDKKTSFGIDSPRGQASIFIYKLLENHNRDIDSIDLMSNLIQIAQPIEFAYELLRWHLSDKEDKSGLFSKEQVQKFQSDLVKRTINESGEVPPFIKYPEIAGYLLRWWSELNYQEVNDNLSFYLSLSPNYVSDFLRLFTPTISSSGYPEPYNGDFSNEQYKFVSKQFDKDMIYNIIMNNFSNDLNEEPLFSDRDNHQTDKNILLQYKYWYEKENKKEELDINIVEK